MFARLILACGVITVIIATNMMLPKKLGLYRDSKLYNPNLDIRSNLHKEKNNFTTYHAYYVMEFCRIDTKFCITDICNFSIEKLVCLECQNFTQQAIGSKECTEQNTTLFMDLYNRCDATMSLISAKIPGPCIHNRPDFITNYVFV